MTGLRPRIAAASGAEGGRTLNLLDATEALSQLSYRPYTVRPPPKSRIRGHQRWAGGIIRTAPPAFTPGQRRISLASLTTP